MQLRTYSVADEFSYHRVIASFDILLHRVPDVPQPVAGAGLRDSQKQGFLCGIQKGLGFGRDLPHREGPGVVAVEPFVAGPYVDAYDVAFFQDGAFAGYAVDDHVVYRDTGAGRKAAVVEEAGGRPGLLDKLADDLIQLPGRDPGLHRFAGQPQRLLGDLPSFAHGGQLAAGFQHDHAKSSRASATRRVVSSMLSWPWTTSSLPCLL